MKNRLTLKSETLAELTPADMRAVVGAAATTKLTTCVIPMLTEIIDPPSNTWACTEGC